MLRKLLSIVCLLSVALLSRADEAVFRQFDASFGLFNNQARHVISMPDHRILVGVSGMYCLYDGSRFLNLNPLRDKALPIVSFINTAHYFDQRHRLWIRDNHELWVIDTDTYQFLSAAEQLKGSGLKDNIETFFIDSDGNAWILTADDQLYVYDWEKPARRVLTLKSDLPAGNRPTICDIVQQGAFHYVFTSDGMMRTFSISHEQRQNLFWLCHGEKYRANESNENLFSNCRVQPILCKTKDENPSIETQNFKLHSTKRVIDERKGYRLKASPWDSGHMLLRMAEGLALFNTATAEVERMVISDGNVTDWTTSGDGTLWVSTRGGIYQTDDELNLLHHFNVISKEQGGIVDNNWLNLTTDWQNGLWVCSFENGVFYYHANSQRPQFAQLHTNQQSAAPKASVIKSLLTVGQQIYALTNDGLYTYDPSTANYRLAHPSFAGLGGKSLTADSDGRIWVSTLNKGIVCYDPARATIDNYSQKGLEGIAPNANFCYPILRSEERGVGSEALKRFLICTHGNDFGILTTEPLSFDNISKRSPELYRFRNMVCAVQLDGGFLVGTQNGYFFYDTERRTVDLKRFACLSDDQHSNKCNALLLDSRRRIWVGTQNGLLCYDEKNKQLRRYDERDGLANCCVQDIMEDSQGNFWIATAHGLAFLNEEKQRIAFHSLNSQFTTPDFLERAHCATADGKFYVGTTMGIVELNPNAISNDKTTLTPQITSIATPNSQLLNSKTKEPLTLKHNENYITISFSALNYLAPHETAYRYRLDGVDKLWVTTDDSRGAVSASYNSLPPGRYTFRAQASLFGGEWGPETTLELRILPPWWATWWARLIYLLLAGAIIAMLTQAYLARRKHKLEAERQETLRQDQERLNEMKFRFFTNISHEFRTPLTLIITPLQTMLERNDLPDDAMRVLDVIKRAAQSLNTMVTQLLDFRSLTQQGATLQPTVVQPDTIFDSTEQMFRPLAEEQGINFTVSKQQLGHATMRLDVPKVQKIVNNLLSNAFKFTPQGGTVAMRVWSEDSLLKISVSDTGVGIKPEDLPHIFDRFYQADNEAQASQPNTGSGIGLNLVKGFAELHGGDVSVESTVGQGTTFTVTLKSQTPPEEADAGFQEEEEEEETDKRVRLLIVEDNKDFRSFMIDQLKEQYHVFAAADGEEGLSTTRVGHPDIIISDVMMPRMDGYQLCRAVKEDLAIAHTPIILLTAKTSDQGRAEGYQAGADSYITKPFNMQVLQACIQMLLDQRRQRQQIFEKENEVNPQKITITPVDERFIQKAMKVMEEHLSDEDYDVVAFSSDMAMERTTLYRKMTAIVGKTPLQFMHSVRMKHAARLLATGEYTVADVAWKVGYSTTKYFSQHFKKAYGVFPSKYMDVKL